MDETLLKEIVSRVQDLTGDGEQSIAKMRETIRSVAEDMDRLKDLDVAKVVERLDSIKARQDTLETAIREHRGGLHVPGLGDYSKQFSVLRAMVAARTGNWDKAGFEKEVMDEARTKASHTIGDDSAGGYFIPDQVIPDVIAAIYTRSVFVNLAGEGPGGRISVLDGLSGANVKIPKFEGGTIAYWIGEEDSYTESQTTVGDMTMTPKKLGVLIRMTDAMRRLQGFGFENLLRQDMTRAMAKKLDWTILYGTGTEDMPLGIANSKEIKFWRQETGEVQTYTQAQAVADWDGGNADFDMITNMRLALEEDDIDLDPSHPVISSPRLFRYLQQLKVSYFSSQSSEQAYLLGSPAFTDAELASLIGPFDHSNQIPSNNKPGESIGGTTDSTVEKYTDVLIGNLSEILLGRWGGLEIASDEGMGKGFPSDHTYMKVRSYLDVGVRQGRALMLCPDAKVRA